MSSLRVFRIVAAVCLVVGLFQSTVRPVQAVTSELDPDFGTNGRVTVTVPATDPVVNQTFISVAVQADGKIVVGGYRMINRVRYLAVWRFLDNGDLDTGFGTGGYYLSSTPDSLVYDLAALTILSETKILLAVKNGSSGIGLIRLNENGTLDTSFGDKGYSLLPIPNENAVVRDMDLEISPAQDHKISFGLSLDDIYESENDLLIAQFNQDGSLNTEFGTQGLINYQSDQPITFTDMAVQSDGRLILAFLNEYPAIEYAGVTRFKLDGDVDTTFGYSGIYQTEQIPQYASITVLSDNSLLLAGIHINGDASLQKLTPDGKPGPGNYSPMRFRISSGYQGGEAFTRIYTQPDGKLLLTGFSRSGTRFIARMTGDLVLDPSYGGGTGIVHLTETYYRGAISEVFQVGQSVDPKVIFVGYHAYDYNPDLGGSLHYGVMSRYNTSLNEAPVIAQGSSLTLTISEDGTPISFPTTTLSATDLEGDAFTWSIGQNGQKGAATLTGEGSSIQVNYAPIPNENGSDSFTVQAVDDEGAARTITINVTIEAVNDPPILQAISGPFAIDELSASPFTLTPTASDVDNASLTFRLEGKPDNMTLDASTGKITWTPSEAQGADGAAGNFPLTLFVSDGAAEVSRSFTIHANEVHTAPRFTTSATQSLKERQPFTLQLSVIDDDLPAQSLTFTHGDLPSGVTFDETSRTLAWTPGEADGGTAPQATFTVSDGTLSSPLTLTLTVAETAEQPVIQTGDQTIDEGKPAVIQITATDADVPVQTLAYKVSSTLPSGATFNTASHQIEWMPTEAQGADDNRGDYLVKVAVSDDNEASWVEKTITIHVAEVNTKPTFTDPGAQTLEEGKSFSLALSGSDGDLPAQDIRFTCTGLPAGATFDASFNTITWTPGEEDGGKLFEPTCALSDGSVSVTRKLSLSVLETAAQPVIQNGDQTIDEGKPAVIQLTATDADTSSQALLYHVNSTLPSGATFNATSHQIEWTPTEAQGADGATGDYALTLAVSDDNGTTWVEKTIIIHVAEVNQAPSFEPLGDRRVNPDQELTFTVNALDADKPDNTLTYSVEGDLPEGAAFDPDTRTFTWTPTRDQSGTHPLTFRVSDGTEAAEQRITITVSGQNPLKVFLPLLTR